MYAKIENNTIVGFAEKINDVSISNIHNITDADLFGLGYAKCIIENANNVSAIEALVIDYDNASLVGTVVTVPTTITIDNELVEQLRCEVIHNVYTERDRRIQYVSNEERQAFGKEGDKQYKGESWSRFYQMLQNTKSDYLFTENPNQTLIDKYNVANTIIDRIKLYDAIADNAVKVVEALTGSELLTFNISADIDWQIEIM